MAQGDDRSGGAVGPSPSSEHDASPSSSSSASTSAEQTGSDSKEQSQPDYEALFEEIKDRTCRVDRIEKVYESGGKRLRTKPHIIDRELERVYEANTLEEIHHALEEAGRNLQQLQIFRNLHMLVHEEPMDDPELVSVLINVEEKNWYKLHAATYVQGNETACEMGVGLHNVSGNAEHFVVSAEIGSEKSNQFSASFEQPKPWDLPITVTTRLSQLILNNQKASSHTEQFRGIMLGLKSFNGRHGLEYELGWRRLADPSGLASRAVLAQVNDYVKSALKYSWSTGDKAVDASTGQLSGWALRTSTEVSGLGFDERLRFGKQQVEWQALLPINSLVTLSLTAAAGLMLPWGPDYASRTTCIADRFFIGGPSTLRGFKFKGVGPTDVRRPARPGTDAAGGGEAEGAAAKLDSLGGDLYTSFMGALLFQLPHQALKALNLQGQVFVNGGNSTQLAGTGRPISATLQDFSRSFRWSAGAGLVLPTVFGRFEANYVVVMSHQETDRLKRGLQLGFVASSLM